MKDLQVKYTDPLDLIPYENNPRINDYAVKKVMESIKEYGFTNPIIVDADMVIIAGHTRREASILAGLDRVPYIVRDDLTPEQVKAYRIADNKLAELSNWDDELLKKELFELQAVDYSLEVMGFTEIDLKEIFTEKEVPKEKKKKEEKTTLPMLRFGSNSVRITEDGATGKGKARQFASYEFVKEEPHIFGRIPIITVYNNEEQMSDLEKIETLVNDYDKVLSDVSNEFEAFRNAYLMLKNMTASGDNIQKLKDEGIIEVMENGDVKFITKEIQTEALENHLNRLEKNIHKFSAVPDLSDENFAGNLSGVAIRFKLFGLETKCIIKERKMEKAIKELVRVLSVPIHVNTGREVDVLNLKVEFSRNVPNNLTEIVDTVTKLDGKVDKETLLSLLPFIDNPKEVLEKLEADKERDRQSTDPYSMQNVIEDSNNLFPNLNAQNSTQEALNAQGATIPQPEQ